MKKMCILMLVLLIINCLSGCNYIENKIAEFEKEQEEYRFKNDIPLDSINAGFGLKTYSPQSENGLPPFFGFKSDTGTFKKDEIEMEVYYGWKKMLCTITCMNFHLLRTMTMNMCFIICLFSWLKKT